MSSVPPMLLLTVNFEKKPIFLVRPTIVCAAATGSRADLTGDLHFLRLHARVSEVLLRRRLVAHHKPHAGECEQGLEAGLLRRPGQILGRRVGHDHALALSPNRMRARLKNRTQELFTILQAKYGCQGLEHLF